MTGVESGDRNDKEKIVECNVPVSLKPFLSSLSRSI